MKSEVEKLNHIPAHETFQIGALLAIVGGFLDAYTYIFRGGVFANAQTGNIVLLAVNFAKGQYKQAMYYILPIVAFALGVFVTEWVKRKFKEDSFIVWDHVVILIEVILLAIIGFLPKEVPDGVVNVTISFICSIQVCSFRKVRNISYASTMCTGNLRSAMENLFSYLIDHNQRGGRASAKYFGIIAFFIVGALAGTILGSVWGMQSIWSCCVLLITVFFILTYKK